MRRSPLLPIFLIVLVDILGLTIMLPLLPFYAEHLGASAVVVGLLTSSYAFCQLIAGPVLGKLSDRMGRKPLLIVSQIGTLIGFLILAASNSLVLVFLSRIIDGLTAGNLSLAQAYIADVTEPENRAKSFGVIGIAFGIGFLIGPGLSGVLFKRFGFSAPIFAAASLSALSIICTSTLLPKAEPHPSDAGSGPGGKRLGVLDWKGYFQYFARPDLGPLLWQFFFFAFSFSLFITGYALFSEGRLRMGPSEVGYVLAWVGCLGIILQGGLMGRLVKKFGERTLVWTGFFVSATGDAWMALVRTFPQMLASATYGAYGGVVRPSVTALISHQADRREQGVVLGLTQSITSVCQIVAPIVAGALIDRGLLSTWALVTGAVAFCGMIAALRFKAVAR